MLYLHFTDLRFDLSLVFFLVWVRKWMKVISRNANIWVFSTLRKESNICEKKHIFLVRLKFFPGKSRPDNSSERILVPVKLSFVCLSTFNIYWSYESSRWPIATSLYQPSSIVVRIVIRRLLTTSSQKLLCQYNLHLWFIASVGNGDGTL